VSCGKIGDEMVTVVCYYESNEICLQKNHKEIEMFYLVGRINATDADTWIAGAGSAPRENLDERGIVACEIYRSADQEIAIITNSYNTLEEAQKDKAMIEAPDNWVNHERMGVESFDIWIVEKKVSR
jgi:hypothetical protein